MFGTLDLAQKRFTDNLAGRLQRFHTDIFTALPDALPDTIQEQDDLAILFKEGATTRSRRLQLTGKSDRLKKGRAILTELNSGVEITNREVSTAAKAGGLATAMGDESKAGGESKDGGVSE